MKSENVNAYEIIFVINLSPYLECCVNIRDKGLSSPFLS